MPATAAWPIVRPVPSQRNDSVSALSKLSSMLSRLRCERWSSGGKTVSRVIRPDNASDACGTRAIIETVPSWTFGSAANVSPGSCSSTLNTVCSEAIGRVRIALTPSSTHPIAGPSATPSSRILPGGAEVDERGPEIVVEDRLDARVVQLVQVDVVDARAGAATRRAVPGSTAAPSRAVVPTGPGTCARRRCRSRISW